MLSLLTTLAPVLIQIAMYLIGAFAKDQATKDANLKAFLDAISAHTNDALASVAERQNAWDQHKDLQDKIDKMDAEAQKPKPPSA
jgi:hypothetical protein